MEWYEEAERRASRVKIIRNVKKSSSITDAFSSGAKNISRASRIEERIDKEGYLTKMGGVVRCAIFKSSSNFSEIGRRDGL